MILMKSGNVAGAMVRLAQTGRGKFIVVAIAVIDVIRGAGTL